MMISDYDLEAMREAQAFAMPDVGTVQRRVASADGFGGHQGGTWETVATGVRARVTPAQTMAMGGQGDRSLELDIYTLRFEWGSDVQDRDRFVWEGQTIDITEVKVPRSFGTVLTAKGEVVKGG